MIKDFRFEPIVSSADSFLHQPVTAILSLVLLLTAAYNGNAQSSNLVLENIHKELFEGELYHSTLSDSAILARAHWAKKQVKDTLSASLVAEIHNIYGGILRHRNNYSKSLECYKTSNSLNEKYGFHYREYVNLGHLLWYIGDRKTARAYYERQIIHYRDSLAEGSPSRLNGMAWGTLHVGRSILADSAERAVTLIRKAIDLWELAGEENRESGAIAYAYSLLAEQSFRNRDLVKLRPLIDSMSFWSKLENVNDGRLELYRAELYLLEGKVDSALHAVNYSLDSTYLTNLEKAYKIKSEVMVKMGNYKEALELKNMSDSIEAIGRDHFGSIAYYREQESLNEIRFLQQLERKEQEKQRTNLLFGAGFLGLLSLGLFARVRLINRSKKMIAKERDRSENLLLNILPEEVAKELKENGQAEAREYDHATILFTDFKQFTEKSELLTAKELVEEINVVFKAFDGICEKFGIEKIKTIGDSFMAAGGLPVPDELSTRNSVLAALEMQAFIENRHSELNIQGKQSFKMRVGLHTGPVIAGIVGVKKFQYDIWGDTVNTASRMESHGGVGMVNISQATYDLIKGDSQFKFEHRGKIEAKGKGEVDMYFVNLA